MDRYGPTPIRGKQTLNKELQNYVTDVKKSKQLDI